MWRKESAKRAPNAIEDIDEFDRNMACVMFDRTVRPTGIILYHNRYSCKEMGEIAGEFERGGRKPTGDISPKQRRRNSDPHRVLARDGKIKFDPDDMGVAHLWIPYGQNPSWVTLECTNPDMRGMPLWLHQRAMENKSLEADEFCSREEQSFFRAKLFDEVANVTEGAAAKHRRLLARALDNKQTQASLARHVEVRSEKPAAGIANDISDIDQPEPNFEVEDMHLAGAPRKDAMQLRPRPKTQARQRPRTWAQQQRDRSGSSERRNTETLSKTGAGIVSKRRSSRGLTWKAA